MISSKSLYAMLFAGLLLAVAGCANRGALEMSRTITVHDMLGRPVEGAHVYVQGQDIVTQLTTGVNGSVTVPVLDRPISLVVSHPGYQVITVSSRANESRVKVVLKEDH